jgi:hypothetical protein
MLPEDSVVSGVNYESACKAYLTKALNRDQPKVILESVQHALSNPMDLTIVAQMLGHGQEPNFSPLEEQYYQIMAEDYKRSHIDRVFPLAEFSECVYKMRLNNEARLPKDDYTDEIRCMEKYKMVLSRQSIDAEGNPTTEWYFRHDKFMEFFIVQTFLGEDNNRPAQHLGDPRFRGVYLLLATLLPLDAAMALRELLIQYAADTQDHTVSDAFVQILRSRVTLSEATGL